MKNLLLLILVLTFASCKKCYDCTTVTTTQYRDLNGEPIFYTYFQNGYSSTSTKTEQDTIAKFETCDKDDMEYFEEPKVTKFTTDYPGSKNGVEVTITVRSYCIGG